MDKKYSVGKLPPDVLKKNVLRGSGAARSEVLIGPGLGEDAALIRWGDEPYLVAASDPIVGAKKGAGRLLVHVNANDVACKGGEPSWFIVTLIIPMSDGLDFIRYIMNEIHLTCKSLNIAVVGGHTELTDRYDYPVIVGTMMGTSSYDLRANIIQAGDVILATKHAGLEGMSIIANDRPDLLSFLSAAEIEEARSWQDDLSVLREARLLRDISRYMHDPTEGGLLGAIEEIQDACGLDAELDNIPDATLAATQGEPHAHGVTSGLQHKTRACLYTTLQQLFLKLEKLFRSARAASCSALRATEKNHLTQAIQK
ncbi:hypothetical protein FACS1894204_11320 [Synergistales bacterium]|nr:hypothetical protein FACS1894204_11320 [Synergistales bacterium]